MTHCGENSDLHMPQCWTTSHEIPGFQAGMCLIVSEVAFTIPAGIKFAAIQIDTGHMLPVVRCDHVEGLTERLEAVEHEIPDLEIKRHDFAI